LKQRLNGESPVEVYVRLRVAASLVVVVDLVDLNPKLLKTAHLCSQKNLVKSAN
jgi:hypothetical protein